MQMKPKAVVGDFITINGRPAQTFEVFAYTHEISVDAEVMFEEIYYDVHCANSGEYVLVSDEDITPCNVTEAVEGVSNDETIDDLLEDLLFALELREVFGDHLCREKKDDYYVIKINDIKSELEAATKEGRN